MPRGARAGAVALIGLWLFGCDNSTRTITPDDPDALVVDAMIDASIVDAEIQPPADAEVADAEAPQCVVDGDCGVLSWCNEGVCTPAPEAPVFAPPDDGVFRAAASAFELVPDYIEPWTDRAGPDCPGNRPGIFDGRTTRPEPFDDCADGFEDVDGDGLFDAVWTARGLDAPARSIDLDHPPQGRVLILSQGAVMWVLITLDTGDIAPGRLARLSQHLRVRLGVPEAHIAIHSTGTLSGPDALGLNGPSLEVVDAPWAEVLREAGPFPLLDDLPFASGVDPRWWASVEARCAAAVLEAGRRLRPAHLRWGTAALPMAPDPVVDGPLMLADVDEDAQPNTARDRSADRSARRWLSRDLRWPAARDHTLRALALEGQDDTPIAHLLLWGTTSTLGADDLALSGGLPSWTRAAVESTWPGTVGIWLSGATGASVRTDDQVEIPQLDEMGRYLDAEGQIVETLDLAAPVPAADRLQALSDLLVGAARGALSEDAQPIAEMQLTQRYVWLPVGNPRLGIAARLGLLPDFGDWLSGRRTTQRWVGPRTTPACGGLGCLRYRLDHVRLGPLTLVTLPGGPSGAFAQGRGEGSMRFGDQPELTDIDTDGVPDDADQDLVRLSTDGTPITPIAPANPQRFEAIVGLEGPQTWLVGHTDGGIGALLPAAEAPNLFEGQLDPLRQYVEDDAVAAIELCNDAYPCQEGLTLGELVTVTLDAQETRLADLPGGHTLWLIDPPEPATRRARPWRLIPQMGDLLEGQMMRRLGEGRAFTLEADFGVRGITRGDTLTLDEGPDMIIGGVVPLVMREHPNATGLWRSASAEAGDLVYNTACTLIFEGGCPHRRPLPWADPNIDLPRAP
ncbi:MAG: hypothetical protein ACE366_17565 [Bradymonadia bacterium]